MKLKNKFININKDLIKRKYFIKYEIKKNILMSIIHNKNLKPILRSSAIYKLSRLTSKSFLSKQNNNICLKTGRIKGVLNLTNLSRHSMKNLAISGYLQNIKIIN